jgi:hypothetical protein
VTSKGKDKPPSAYQVGFGKPPAQTRFKKANPAIQTDDRRER